MNNDVESIYGRQSFVYPWMGIVANVPHDHEMSNVSSSKLRDFLSDKGFNPLGVETLWNSHEGFTGFALVEFTKDWPGFSNAMAFEKMFETNSRGKDDYFDSSEKGSELYGWVARDDDYNSSKIYGEHIRKKGELKTIGDLEEEDVSLKEIEHKYNETSLSLNKLLARKDELHRLYEEESFRMQEIVSRLGLQLKELEEREAKLEKREAELGKQEALNEKERQKLDHHKEMNERATAEQKIANENMLKLVEEHQKEKQKLERQIIEMRKKLDAKHALELEIQCLRGAIQIQEHMIRNYGDEEKLSVIRNDFKEKEKELEALIAKEREGNDELQEARKAIIKALKDETTRVIGVKRMGELDVAPFREAVKRTLTLSGTDIEERAMLLCLQWQEELSDSNWYPFKEVEFEQIIDSDDKKLKMLRNQWGNEAHEAVVTALKEMNEYNPTGRYPVPELWNFKQNKKATLKEVVYSIVDQWKRLKRRK